MLHNRRRHLLLPSGVVPLGSSVRPLGATASQCPWLGRGETRRAFVQGARRTGSRAAGEANRACGLRLLIRSRPQPSSGRTAKICDRRRFRSPLADAQRPAPMQRRLSVPCRLCSFGLSVLFLPRGTEGSNLASSSGESGANRDRGDRVAGDHPGSCRDRSRWSRRATP
jgi:hypothetical protein